MDKFTLWCKYLKITSLVLCLQGLSWVIVGSFDPFGFYEYYVAKTFWNLETLSPENKTLFRFLLIPFGATDAAYFLLFYWVVKYPLAKREKWAYLALVSTLGLWFFVDTAFSLYVGAYFNVWIVNIPCIVILIIPIAAIYSYVFDNYT